MITQTNTDAIYFIIHCMIFGPLIFLAVALFFFAIDFLVGEGLVRDLYTATLSLIQTLQYRVQYKGIEKKIREHEKQKAIFISQQKQEAKKIAKEVKKIYNFIAYIKSVHDRLGIPYEETIRFHNNNKVCFNLHKLELKRHNHPNKNDNSGYCECDWEICFYKRRERAREYVKEQCTYVDQQWHSFRAYSDEYIYKHKEFLLTSLEGYLRDALFKRKIDIDNIDAQVDSFYFEALREVDELLRTREER